MNVSRVLKRLQKERRDEELVFIMQDDRGNYYTIDERPFLHGGPRWFLDNEGKPYWKSVVMVRLQEYENPKGPKKKKK